MITRRIVRTAPVIPGAVPTEAMWAFHDRLRHVGGHRIWRGSTERGTTPVFHANDQRYPALRVAWVLHHGTDPVGLVLGGCNTPLCVRGAHLTDEVIRQRERIIVATLHGITLAGLCRAGLHDLAEYGGVRPPRTVVCRACENARRLAATRKAPEGVPAA